MITIHLEKFEGPMGLLLYLIRKEEMDIYDIPIHRITSQYLEHIKRMRELDLEVAGEFVAMAATLIHIKSKMLLPQYDEKGEVIEATDDPRKELVQRLLEYEKYQEAARSLNERPLLGRDVWRSGSSDGLPTADEEVVIDEAGLFSLISAFRNVMRQVKKNVHTVRAKGQSIAARIMEIRDRLMPGRRVTLNELIAVSERSATKVLITFLSLLELTKMGFTSLFQTETYGDIYVDTLKPVERDVIERVEEYDTKLEQVEEISRELEAEAGGRDLLDLNQTPEDQLGLWGEAAMAPEIASDDDILAAEAELGLREEGVDLSVVDRALENFALEAPAETEALSSGEAVAGATDMTTDLGQTDVGTVEEARTEPLFNPEDFELAWANFEETVEVDKEETPEAPRLNSEVILEAAETEVETMVVPLAETQAVTEELAHETSALERLLNELKSENVKANLEANPVVESQSDENQAVEEADEFVISPSINLDSDAEGEANS